MAGSPNLWSRLAYEFLIFYRSPAIIGRAAICPWTCLFLLFLVIRLVKGGGGVECLEREGRWLPNKLALHYNILSTVVPPLVAS